MNNTLKTLCCLSLIGLLGCSTKSEDSKSASFEKVEKEIEKIQKEVQIKDTRDRIYYNLYPERGRILNIAKGDFNSRDSQDLAMIRMLAWTVLAEMGHKSSNQTPDYQDSRMQQAWEGRFSGQGLPILVKPSKAESETPEVIK